MPKKIRIQKQLAAGRPKKPIDVASSPEKPLQKFGGDLSTAPHYGSLPTKIIGSHQGQMLKAIEPMSPLKGPALPRPPKLMAKPRKGPPPIP